MSPTAKKAASVTILSFLGGTGIFGITAGISAYFLKGTADQVRANTRNMGTVRTDVSIIKNSIAGMAEENSEKIAVMKTAAKETRALNNTIIKLVEKLKYTERRTGLCEHKIEECERTYRSLAL